MNNEINYECGFLHTYDDMRNYESECTFPLSKFKDCDKNNCVFKQLLAEQAKNKELENQRTVDCEECERNNSKNSSCFECLCIKLNSEQDKNKKLIEALESVKDNLDNILLPDYEEDYGNYNTFYQQTSAVITQALNEVNK